METWTRLVNFHARGWSRENNPRQGARQGDKRFTSPSSPAISVFRGYPDFERRDREAQQLGTRGSGVKYLAPIRTNAVARIEHLLEGESLTRRPFSRSCSLLFLAKMGRQCPVLSTQAGPIGFFHGMIRSAQCLPRLQAYASTASASPSAPSFWDVQDVPRQSR